jgi:hypothetical protein
VTGADRCRERVSVARAMRRCGADVDGVVARMGASTCDDFDSTTHARARVMRPPPAPARARARGNDVEGIIATACDAARAKRCVSRRRGRPRTRSRPERLEE